MSTLPKSGWITHTEQIKPGVGEFWHMKTVLPGGFEVLSVDTRTAPDWCAKILATGRTPPRYATLLSKNKQPVEHVTADTAEEAERNHHTVVRGVIDGIATVARSNLFNQQPVGKA